MYISYSIRSLCCVITSINGLSNSGRINGLKGDTIRNVSGRVQTAVFFTRFHASRSLSLRNSFHFTHSSTVLEFFGQGFFFFLLLIFKKEKWERNQKRRRTRLMSCTLYYSIQTSVGADTQKDWAAVIPAFIFYFILFIYFFSGFYGFLFLSFCSSDITYSTGEMVCAE